MQEEDAAAFVWFPWVDQQRYLRTWKKSYKRRQGCERESRAKFVTDEWKMGVSEVAIRLYRVLCLCFICQNAAISPSVRNKDREWFHRLMVRTSDSESGNGSSILPGTSFFLLCFCGFFYIVFYSTFNLPSQRDSLFPWIAPRSFYPYLFFEYCLADKLTVVAVWEKKFHFFFLVTPDRCCPLFCFQHGLLSYCIIFFG